MILVSTFGAPGITGVLYYALGAITGFGLTTLLAYEHFFGSPDYEQPEYLIFSTIHYLSSLAPIIATYFYTLAYPSLIGSGMVFFLSGVSVSFTYNILMLVEEKISEEVKQLEERILK